MTSLDEQILQRRTNLDELSKLGLEIYPRKFERRHTIAELVEAHVQRTHDELEGDRIETITGGRILAIRAFGKAGFLVLSDGHAKIQVYIRMDSMPELDFKIHQLLDFGDWVGVEGRLFRTKTNELTIWASRLHFLAKCLLPLPEKWHGLTDVEIRYRQRYLDLIVNPESRGVFEARSRIISAMREFMTARGYLEVETPMMEFYEAYADYQALMTMTEEMIGTVARTAVGTDRIAFGDHQIALTAPFARLSLREAARDAASRRLHRDVSDADLRARDRAASLAGELAVEVDPGAGAGAITMHIFEALCEEHLIQPTFVYDFPTEVS